MSWPSFVITAQILKKFCVNFICTDFYGKSLDLDLVLSGMMFIWTKLNRDQISSGPSFVLPSSIWTKFNQGVALFVNILPEMKFIWTEFDMGRV